MFVGQGVFFIRANSQTVDEATHLAAGYSYLTTRDFRLDAEHPPFIKELQALPLWVIYELPFRPDLRQWRDADQERIGLDFLYNSPIPADQILAWSRFTNLFLGVLLVALIGWWAYRLWGSLPAMLAITLASLEPNLVAHSALVTTDLGVALFIFLTVYLLWEYLQLPTWYRLVAVGVSTGLALASKFSALFLVAALSLILALLVIAGEHCALPLNKTRIDRWPKIVQAGTLFLIVLFVAFLIIVPVYFFQGIVPWVTGLREFLGHADTGHLSFFLGNYSYQGWWDYFGVAFLIKTPIGSLLLIAASLASLPRWETASAAGRNPAFDSTGSHIHCHYPGESEHWPTPYFAGLPLFVCSRFTSGNVPIATRVGGPLAYRHTDDLYSDFLAPHQSASACLFQ